MIFGVSKLKLTFVINCEYKERTLQEGVLVYRHFSQTCNFREHNVQDKSVEIFFFVSHIYTKMWGGCYWVSLYYTWIYSTLHLAATAILVALTVF